MDKRLVQIAAGVGLVATLGAFAGAGSDRGVVVTHSHASDASRHDVAHRAGHMVVMHAQAGEAGE